MFSMRLRSSYASKPQKGSVEGSVSRMTTSLSASFGAPSQRRTTVALTRLGWNALEFSAELEPSLHHQSQGRFRMRTTVVLSSSTEAFFPDP